MTATERKRIANKYAGKRCTLNGQAATVTGRLNRFAKVVRLQDTELGTEWSWETVERIMEKGGKFVDRI